ncbi:MAG: DNA polymerase II large subunit [Promethearchaeota archaeon]
MRAYFDNLERRVREIYSVAERARKVGIDPANTVESPPAMDMAGRVENLVGPKGVAARIRELKENGVDQDDITFTIATEVLEGKFGERELENAIELAIRVALAIKTEGVVSAPLEGISSIKLRDNGDGTKYLSIYYAGPIRAAGGTVAAFSVLISDYVRRKAGIPAFQATKAEAARMREEVKLYDRIMNLQYPSTPEELEEATLHIPVELNGDPTERREVSANRNLPRIETNFVRGGCCLVLNDGILLKASKLLKIIDAKGIEGWDWLHELKEKKDHAHASVPEGRTQKEGEYGGGLYQKNKEGAGLGVGGGTDGGTPKDDKVPPVEKYIADIIAGRPVFGYPSRKGAYRIRYGRSRNTGLAACGLHPASMTIVGRFCAIGTQTRIERPGKSSSTMPVDSIEGPVVKLRSGDVVQLTSAREAAEVFPDVEEILFLGDILFGYGEFAENNHKLVPSGYCEEWWVLEVCDALGIPDDAKGVDDSTLRRVPRELEGVLTVEVLERWLADPVSAMLPEVEAFLVSDCLGVPLHPRYLHHWNNIPPTAPGILASWFNAGSVVDGRLHLPLGQREKGWLEDAFVPHAVEGTQVVLAPVETEVVSHLFPSTGKDGSANLWTPRRGESTIDVISRVSGVLLRDKAPYYMGMRMGRPEKAKERRMNPPVHALFPLSHKADSKRSFKNTGKMGRITIDVAQKQCPKCGWTGFLNLCPKCHGRTEFNRVCPQCREVFPNKEELCPRCNVPTKFHAPTEFNFAGYFRDAQKKLGTRFPEIKGVKGMSSLHKVPEPIEKGMLRAKHGVFVYKDGTIRFDSTDVPLTHFTPREVRTPVSRLLELGYSHDVKGDPLVEDTQVLELKVQDILIPRHCADYFLKVAAFVDEELEVLYGMEPFYQFQNREDLIGAIMVGLAPHTSAAIVGRVVGFTLAHSGYAHPYWHAAKRRNCDGDEDGLMLLLEMLLNFSQYYLPAKIGGKMDAPLVTSIILDPKEIDAEAHNVDCSWRYPLWFYEETLKYANPMSIYKRMDMVSHRLGTPAQYEGIGFTHPTTSINDGPKITAYKKLKTMRDKIESQMHLAQVIRSNDAEDIARKILSSHFTPDIMGNLRAFSTQTFRCVKCNEKFRRPPLSGKCTRCGGNLLMTVTQGGITKYLPIALEMTKKFHLGSYTKQRMELAAEIVTSLTDNPRVKQKTLADFF